MLNGELSFLHDWCYWFTKNEFELFIRLTNTENVIFGAAMKRNQINSGKLSEFYLGDQVLYCWPFH